MRSVFKFISLLANSQRRYIDHLAADREYSGAQGKLIHYLFTHRHTTVCQKDIEKAFGLRAPTATELLKTLEKKGLVKKVPDKNDARYKTIHLTPLADKYQEDVFHDMEQLETRLTDNISEDELNTWIQVSHKMLTNLSGGKNEK